MRVLLVHPEDSLRSGPWAGQKWDLIVDLGRSSESTERAWQEIAQAPVVRLEAFRHPVEDARSVAQILSAGNGLLTDSEDLDWWELLAFLVHAELETVLLLRRMLGTLSLTGPVRATRGAWPISGLALLANVTVEPFSQGTSLLRHYLDLSRKLPAAKISEIVFDKYDAGYAWRGLLTPARPPSIEPVVLLPSAYTNVSRAAAAYARLLPEMKFLLVATRRSGLAFDRPENVSVAKLGSFASASSPGGEQAKLNDGWAALVQRMAKVSELAPLVRLGVFNRLSKWVGHAIRTRDAWKRVLDRELVSGVLCGDDSNWYTRLPVELARRRGIPTVDFHHGAFDGRFLLKALPSDWYLAKTLAERDYLSRICGLPTDRVVLGLTPNATPASRTQVPSAHITYFSEPYETSGGRAEEIYRELLPALCKLARDHQTSIILKLHPFENVIERSQLLKHVLSASDRQLVNVSSGPLSDELLQHTWFGITFESTTVMDCTFRGVPCFLCEWLLPSPYGYLQQYARFGIGRRLRNIEELLRVPEILLMPAQDPVREAEAPLASEQLRKFFEKRVTSSHALTR